MLTRRAFFCSTLFMGTALGFSVACGGISDPTLKSPHVATITGSLTSAGTSAPPSGARVALVWSTGTTPGLAVGADVPVVNGQFTMAIDAPPDSYFVDPSASEVSLSSPPPPMPSSASAPAGESPGSSAGSSSSGGPTVADAGVTGQSLRPLGGGNVSGSVGSSMLAAFAGFVVYADANGNGKLDLVDTKGTSPDTFLGGNKELFIVDLRGGTSLDYEKMRDKAGVLPTEGINLGWTEDRWLPLNEVELKLSSPTSSQAHLASQVCYASQGATVSTDPSFGSSSAGSATTSSDAPGQGPAVRDAGTSAYPQPGDPGLKCSPDGRSFTYTQPCPPPPPPPPPAPPSLCGWDEPTDSVGYACPSGGGSALAPGEAPPPGWPCPTAAPDAGVADSGTIVVVDAAAD